MTEVFEPDPAFTGVEVLIRALSEIAKSEMELFRSDPLMFRVWPAMVSAGEAIELFRPNIAGDADQAQRLRVAAGRRLLINGKNILFYLAGARVPMPKTTRQYFAHLTMYTQGRIDMTIA
jgi:hypothetical protein